MPTVLIVEDDARLCQLLVQLLEAIGLTVTTETDSLEASRRIVRESPDLVLLDVGLPGLDGFEVCKRVRAAYRGRILVLTARGDEVDEVTGLSVGADDFLGKPVSAPILQARVRALLRRERATTGPIRNGRLTIHPGTRQVELDGLTLPLRTAEFEVLMVLARHVGTVVERDDLYQEILGRPYDGVDRSIDLRISRIRRHLGDPPRQPFWIRTIFGTGYLLAVDEEA